MTFEVGSLFQNHIVGLFYDKITSETVVFVYVNYTYWCGYFMSVFHVLSILWYKHIIVANL